MMGLLWMRHKGQTTLLLRNALLFIHCVHIIGFHCSFHQFVTFVAHVFWMNVFYIRRNISSKNSKYFNGKVNALVFIVTFLNVIASPVFPPHSLLYIILKNCLWKKYIIFLVILKCVCWLDKCIISYAFLLDFYN